MEIGGHLELEKEDIETEFLRKRMDGLSTRITLAFFFFVALLGIFLVLAYFYIDREIENLKKEQADILSPDHAFAQKFELLSGMSTLLSDEIKKQTEALETARLDLKKNSDAMAARIKALENSGDLKQAKESLRKLEASEKAFSAKLATMEKNLAALADLPALVEGVKKENQDVVAKNKDMSTRIQSLQNKQKSLESDIALFPIDSVQKSELNTAVKRQDSERASLESRLNRKIQQMQASVDAMRGSSSSSSSSSRSSGSGATTWREETLTE